jgi:long-chain acyl-CoA synthetase
MLALSHFVTRAALVNGNGTATIDGDRRRTWSEVLSRVQRSAASLTNLGLEAGERLAILSPNSDTYLEYLFSVNWAGGVIVPINTRLAGPEILYWLEDSGSKILVVAEPLVELVQSLRAEMSGIEHFIYLGNGPTPEGFISHEEILAAAEPAENAGRGDNDIAALFYTGGTTGRSKGVIITHAGLYINILQWIAAVGVTADDRFLIIPPMFHAAGGMNSMAVAALAATAYMMPQFDVLEGLHAIERERLTKIPLVATMLDMMVNHPQIDEFDLSSVQRITYGASPIHERILLRSLEVLPQVKFIQIFGQTEGGPAVTALAPRYHVIEGPDSGKLTSAGQPLIGTEIAILNEAGEHLPCKVPGEIAVKGPGVSPGYWNLPDVTRESRAGDFLRTGDAGYLDEDGYLFISDRIKDMIISGGENVYPAEVEAVLMTRKDIIECAVIGIPSDKWGEQVHSIVRLEAGSTLSEEELIAHCRKSLAGYKCVRSVEFRKEPFPLSATNKILKRELRKPYWDRQ